MAINQIMRYVCDNDPAHTIDSTSGGLPPGWVQLIFSFNGTLFYFDSLECAGTYRDAHDPALAES